jgi:hypothetical protein
MKPDNSIAQQHLCGELQITLGLWLYTRIPTCLSSLEIVLEIIFRNSFQRHHISLNIIV